ncbi:MAG: hypothetical protein SNJ67_12325 [Chloracidobacterium sp.]
METEYEFLFAAFIQLRHELTYQHLDRAIAPQKALPTSHVDGLWHIA